MQTSPRSWVLWLRDLLAGAVLVLAVLLAARGAQYRTLQDEVNTQRAQLQGAQAFASVNDNLVRLLAQRAAETNDEALTALLARNGVTFQAAPPGQAPAAPATGGAQ